MWESNYAEVRSALIGATLYLAMLTAMSMHGCGAQQNPKCPDVDLASIEARYVAEVVAACQDYGGESEPPVEECPDYPRLRDKYDAMRKEWVECR